MRARWIAASVGLAGTAAAALTALAQGPAAQVSVPVLHEDMRSPVGSAARGRRAPTDAPALFGRDLAAGHNPTAIREDQKILPEPEARAEQAREEPIHGRGGFGADRSTETVPDAQTGGDDALRYVEVFNPSVVPFKRMSALDAVRSDFTLGVADLAQTEVRVTGEPTQGYDRFWGSMLIDLRPGEEVPIPSVAPEMRIVSYEVEPRTQLSFSVDGAHNFYVRGDEPDARGVHRLVFLVEASPRYFAPIVPSDVSVADLPSGRVRTLPPQVQGLAEQVHRSLRVDRTMRLREALDRLVKYFRAFEPKEIRRPTGNIYWDLVTQQAGVCRHRAFAFMITANALGIPTRFVSNEAHAWVEVWAPRGRGARDGGWLRIDLGGAALSLEVMNAAGKSMYRPRGEDPFPKPPEYSQNYTRLEGDISGLSEDQIAEARTPRDPPSADPNGENSRRSGAGSAGSGGSGAEAGAGSDGARGEGADDGAAGDPGADDEPPVPSPARGLPLLPAADLDGKRPTAIRVTSASSTGFRGEAVSIVGTVAGAGDVGLAGQHVVLYLAPAGQRGAGAQIVGHARSLADGSFRAEVVIPFELELAEHEVFASTPGDDRQRPAISE